MKTKLLTTVITVSLLLFAGGGARAQEASCPLLDNNVYQDLLVSVDQLESIVGQLPNCKNEDGSYGTSVTQAQRTSQNLRDASLALANYWKDPSTAVDHLDDFEKQIQTAAASVEQIATSLSNNQLISSKCGQMDIDTGSVVSSLADIVTTLSPYLMMAGSLSPDIGLPVSLGIVGLASVVKVVDKMVDANSLDMNDNSQRMTVLKMTCQFKKVTERTRYLKLAESGQIRILQDDVAATEKEIEDLKNKTASSLDAQTSLVVSQQKTLKDLLLDFQAKAKKFDQIKQFLNNKSDNIYCMTVTRLVRDNQFALPQNLSALLEEMLSSDLYLDRIQVQTMIENQEMLFENLKAFKQEDIKKCYGSTSGSNNGGTIPVAPGGLGTSYGGFQNGISNNSLDCSCAYDAKDFVGNLADIYTFIPTVLNVQITKNESILSSSPDYKGLIQQVTEKQNEKKTLEQLKDVIERLTKDDAAISKSEIDQRMARIQAAIFGSTAAIQKNSPATQWLTHTIKMHQLALNQFSTSFNQLAGLGGTYNNVNCLFCSRRTVTRANSDTFSGFTAKAMPVGSAAQKKACKELENVWIDWTAVMDHLKAVNLYCEFISPVLNNMMDPSLSTSCIGNVDLKGNVLIKSSVQKLQSALVDDGYAGNAQLISQKMAEIKCEMPTYDVFTN